MTEFLLDVVTEDENPYMKRIAEYKAVPAHIDEAVRNELEFLEQLSPEYAFISCGENNDYGHPHDSVLQRLEDVGAAIYRTNREGTLVLRIREGQITVEIENRS